MSVTGNYSVDEDRYLAAAVARRYYLDDASKTEIGNAMGLSRFKVARLLTLARELGLVTIEVSDPSPLEDPLAQQLSELFGLESCVVVRSGLGSGDDNARFVGEAGGRLLQEAVQAGDLLGLPWSRAVHHAIRQLSSLPELDVVQLCGSLILPEDGTPYDVVRQVGALIDGRSSYFHAPMIMASAEGANAVRSQVDVARAMALLPNVNVTLCSIGAWQPGCSSIYDVLDTQDRERGTAAGAVGEIVGILFDSAGQILRTDLADRVVGLTGEQLRQIPTVIGMCRGARRAAAVRAAIAGGLVTHLVVDEELARALVQTRVGA